MSANYQQAQQPQQQPQQQQVQPSPQPQQQQQPQQHNVTPLFDLFLDLPHPLGSTACAPPVILGGPTSSPAMEKELTSNMSRIARFAFPEFDDAVAANVPRNQAINRYSMYAMQSTVFQQYTFSMQLQSGVRLHGHVRRYLPSHTVAKTRYDVGRRGERALIMMTRSNGGDLVYSSILKTLDAISSQQSTLKSDEMPHADNPQKWFLHALFRQHQALVARFAALPPQERKPMVLTIEGLEAGDINVSLMKQVDTSRYLLPTTLLTGTPTGIESIMTASILPIIRVIGVSNTMRLISALLSERRVLLMSASATRLGQCTRSALSIIAQGLLNWQHLYIPVLPPHLFQYLAAPVPYLIGILKALKPRLDSTKPTDLGEVVIIDLDMNTMETRGIAPHEVSRKIPDLIRPGMGEGSSSANMSATEQLAQDMVDLLKVDKRALYGESTLTNVSETAAKATKAVKTGLLKLRDKGKQFLRDRAGVSGIGADAKVSPEKQQPGSQSSSSDNGPPTPGSLIPDFIYSQGSQNETAEEEARIAFTSFFLSMYGDMRWYLAAAPGKLPELDRQRFLQQKRASGDEHTSIWPLLGNFCQTQMLEQFANARVEEVRTRMPVTAASPLFSQCANYHRLHNIDFHPLNVRRVARQVAQHNPSRRILQTTARRMAMLLTSNRTFEGDYNKTVAQLVEQCRECSSVLFDVMSVIWVRMRDSKGLHWKHGYQALQILRNLLYHGPMAAIAEATDGMDKIRSMKFYNDNMRSQICTQIRHAASQVYNLLVDRAKLFAVRRLCLNKRRLLRRPDQGHYIKDSRIRPSHSFKAIHAAFHPNARGQVAPAPANPANAVAQFTAMQNPVAAPYPGQAAVGSYQQQQQYQENPFALTAPGQPAPAPTATANGTSAAQDVLGLFDTMTISNNAAKPPGIAGTPAAHDPFASSVTPAPQANTSAFQQQQQQPLQQPQPQQQAYGQVGGYQAAPAPAPSAQHVYYQQQQQQQQQQQYQVQRQPQQPAAANAPANQQFDPFTNPF